MKKTKVASKTPLRSKGEEVVESQKENGSAKKRRLTPVEAEIRRIEPQKNSAKWGKPSLRGCKSPQSWVHAVDFVEDGNYVHMESAGMHTEFLEEGESESEPEAELIENLPRADPPSKNNNTTLNSGPEMATGDQSWRMPVKVQKGQGRRNGRSRSETQLQSSRGGMDSETDGSDGENNAGRR